MKYRPITKRIGILGGGQLARMLAMAAHSLGYIPVVLSAHKEDPAAQVVSQWIQGDPNDATAQKRLMRLVDVATFESEFLDGKGLQSRAREAKVPVFPKPALMDKLRDRLKQKRLLEANKVPTSPFRFWNSKAACLRDLAASDLDWVFKRRTGGYDGYGTFIVRAGSPLPEVIAQNPQDFIAEEFVPFKRELAICFARDRDGELISLPWVESYQENARCDWVQGPIYAKRLDRFASQLRHFVHEIGYVGVIAFEVFDTGTSLLVNEIAPRVHNTAHYTMDAMTESQFTLHIKAIAGDHLNPPQILQGGFAMANLLGKGKGLVKVPVNLKASLHWYGKSQNREGRKMGHLNTTGKNPKEALNLALKERRKIKL